MPLNLAKWFVGFGAHPKEGEVTLIASETTVNPSGSVEFCRPSLVFGDAAWAAFTCKLITKRGKFRPAQLGGRSTYGVFRLRNVWIKGGPIPTDCRFGISKSG